MKIIQIKWCVVSNKSHFFDSIILVGFISTCFGIFSMKKLDFFEKYWVLQKMGNSFMWNERFNDWRKKKYNKYWHQTVELNFINPKKCCTIHAFSILNMDLYWKIHGYLSKDSAHVFYVQSMPKLNQNK